MMNVRLSVKLIFATCGLIVLMQMRTSNMTRRLSVTDNLRKLLTQYLGNGKCIWEKPEYDPDAADYYKSLVVGYPGGSKRIIYEHIEAMTGLAFNDEWPSPSNNPNRPFTKGNYPHHEGRWGYGNNLNQVIMILRNPMKAIVEYHDVRHDMDYAIDPQSAFEQSENLYVARPTVESWREWRDLRLPAEIQWYGWFIDYWMEGGLLRDIPSHEPVHSEFWKEMFRNPGPYYESGQAFANDIGNADVSKEYDSHCTNDMPNGSCEPALVISAERIFQKTTGPTELLKVASVLDSKPGIEVIDHGALPCIWDELMVAKKGLPTMFNRTGTSEESDFKFKLPYLTEMLSELSRLRTKYSGPEWSTKTTAQDLVTILNEYILDINAQIQFGNFE